ncbi:MAG: NUDIX domain-containing protein, partial [Spirochaetales bacterium]|nr:NUDIX domain-containing protein [Candidatus Physcosoma equi]
TSFQAVCREVMEETGLDVSSARGGYQFCYHRENPGQNYIVDIYRFEMDVTEEDLKLQEEETMGGRFATLEEIQALDKEGIFLHYQSIKKVFED